MARPQKTWTNRDFEQFEALCRIQCSKADICAVMDVSEKTLDRLIIGEGRVLHFAARRDNSSMF